MLLTLNSMCLTEGLNDGSSDIEVVLLKPFAEHLQSFLLYITVSTAQLSLYLTACFCRSDKRSPFWLDVLGVTCDNLHLISTLQYVTERHEFMVHFCTNAMRTEECMDMESEVERCSSGRERDYFSLGFEDKYLLSKEIELDSIEEIHSIWLWIIKNFLDSAEPVIEFSLIIGFAIALLIFPMGGKSLLCNLIHAVGTNLHLYPSALITHKSHMESLIAISLRMTEPVTQTVRMRLVKLCDSHIDTETLIYLFFDRRRGKDDSYGKDIIYFIE